MRKFTIAFAMLFTMIGFSQNQSLQAISTPFINPVQQFGGGEIFRFAPGIVTQLDLGTSFDFSTSRWFALGKLNTGTQTVYGLRFQLPNKSLTLGYRDLADVNPRLEWIGTGTGLGNLEFRVATSFTSTTSNLVATMTNDGNTYFGNALFTGTKVGIDYKTLTGLTLRTSLQSSSTVTALKLINNVFPTYAKEGINIESNGTSKSTYSNIGVTMNLSGGDFSTGIGSNVSGSSVANGLISSAKDGSTANVGIKGTISNAGGFGAGIWGVSPNTNTNWYAGLFDGKVVVNGAFSTPSDAKLKENIIDEEGLLEKLIKLNPINYNFSKNDKINLPTGIQHGFLAQNIEESFPELVISARKPIFDESGRFIEYYDYETVNYIGLISILTSGIKDLNSKINLLEQSLINKNIINKDSLELKTKIDKINSNFSLEQNVPNPFTNETIINYVVPENSNSSLSIFDLTGKLIKDYSLNSTSGQIKVNSSDIGKGIFIYSIIMDNTEILSKKMIIK